MSEQIWFADAVRSLDLTRGFFANFGEGKPRQEEIDLHYQTLRQMFAGKLLPDEEMPKGFYSSVPEHFDEKLPGFFHTGYIFFKKGVADIFRSFDMGDAYFRPVELFQHDRATPINQEIFLLCIGNTKETVVVDETARIKAKKRGMYHLPFMPKDADVVTSKGALHGPDIWVDPRIDEGVFFMSDRLAKALIKAGLKNKLELLKTRTV